VVDHPDDRLDAAPLLADEAAAPWNSTSEEGSERVPSLSFSCWMRKPGSLDSKKKQERPPGAWASVRNTSQEG
jgi:hypothetical protein